MRREITGFSNPTVKYLRSLREKKHRKAAGKFLAEGLRLLEDARACGHLPEVLVMANGRAPHPLLNALEREVLEAGDGPIPAEGDTVRVHYTGTLEDGTVFDSSLDRGEPIEFPLGQGFVIPGWEIGIAEMQVGEKAILTIPSALAYGPQGSPPTIPPDATLIFEVELVEIVGQ